MRLDMTEAADTNTASGSAEAAITDSRDVHDHAADAGRTDEERPSESDLRVRFGLEPIGAGEVHGSSPVSMLG